MAEKLLEVKNLRTEFKRDKTWVTAVNNVSFSIQPGEILGLVGESGCGKSVTSLSIMKLLARNSKISNGEILLNGKDLLKEDKKGMRKIRGREVAMIFQEPMNSLNPCMRIEKQLTEAILLHNNFSKEEAHNRAFEVLKSVGIPEPDMTLKSYPHQLSGGMCQRVMIAMAMSCEPELLIADEPTTALDVTIQAQILELMEDIRAKKNTGILMITHDLGVVAEMCSRVVVMYAGRIVEEAPVQELFADPKHPYTQGLIGSVPKLGSGVESLPSIPGSVPDLSVMPKGCKFAPRCKYAMDICHQQEPELLIADEPTTALDVTIQAQILELMEEIRAKKNTGILMITHDLGVVAEMCSRVVVMYAGRIVEEAPVQELFADPKHPYTQGLIGSVPKLGSGVESLPSIPGSVPDLSVMPKGCKFAPRCKYAMDICHQQEPELADINEAGTRKCRCHLLNKTGKEA